MGDKCRCRSAVTDGFEEVGLALGGIIESYELPEDAVWDLARAIDLAHERIQAQLMRVVVEPLKVMSPSREHPHPAVSHLMNRLAENRNSSDDRGAYV